MNNQDIILSNFRRFCHRAFRNEATAQCYKTNLRYACERAKDYRYPSFTELRTAGEVLEQLRKLEQRYLLSGNYCSAVRKYATYLATFRRAAA